jgi:hypothetical protein
MTVVDSRPPVKQRQYTELDYNYAAPGCAWVIGGVALLALIALYMGEDWASHTLLRGIWLFAMWACGLVLVPCMATIGWHYHKAMKRHEHEETLRRNEQRLLREQVKLTQQANLLMQESRMNNDNVKIQLQYGENGVLRSQNVEVIRAAVLVAQANQGRARHESTQLQIGTAVEEEKLVPVLLPIAPNFWDVIDLISSERMPLCFVIDDDPGSRTYGQTIPAFGTILDLLSLCVIGKPGRGKSVLLLYYLCILAKYGAEIHILDPQGAFKELELLHGRRLPAMPETARIYYYSELEEMKKAVTVVLADIKERGELYKPHMEDGELILNKVKHPLVLMADELPIIAEMDAEIKAKTKEENKARKLNDEELEKILQVTGLVKTSVLAARKYGVYFIGASQSIDATILPTRVTAGFNSRIIFYSEQAKARMAGVESDVAKRLLPVIRRAGPGMTIYDCGRWNTPLVAAFPNVAIKDVLLFFGISMEELKALWIADLAAKEQQLQQPQTRITGPLAERPIIVQSKKVVRRATLTDAIAVWNESPIEIGRPRLRDELQARGLECSDDLAKQLLKAIKQRLENNGVGGGSESESASI